MKYLRYRFVPSTKLRDVICEKVPTFIRDEIYDAVVTPENKPSWWDLKQMILSAGESSED